MKLGIIPLLISCSLGSFLRAGEYHLLALQYPPYAYQTSGNGEVQGVAVEVIREAFARMGHTLTIQIMPWPRVLQKVKDGEVDGFFTTYHVPDREAWADYSSEELAPQVTSIFVKKGAAILYKGDLAQLAGQSIGVVTKVSYGSRFDRAVQDKVLPHVMESVDGATNFRQLLAGRVSVVASNRMGGRFILNEMGRRDEVVELGPPLESLPSYLAFSKLRNLKWLRVQFDKTLQKMKADGTWGRIMKPVEP